MGRVTHLGRWSGGEAQEGRGVAASLSLGSLLAARPERSVLQSRRSTSVPEPFRAAAPVSPGRSARSMAPPKALAFGFLLAAITATLAAAQKECSCNNYKLTTGCFLNENGECQCTAIGTQNTVLCSKLASKCLVMKAEMTHNKAGKRQKPEEAIQNNDGLYDPECDEQGLFKAKQCNGTATCWCVNSAGVRRTDKDTEITCSERVRT